MAEISGAPPSPYVFLSYVRENLQPVDCLAEGLRDAGFNVWLDRNAIHGGEAWINSIKGERTCNVWRRDRSSNQLIRTKVTDDHWVSGADELTEGAEVGSRETIAP